MAMVCKQVMNEILSIFYRENTFIFRRRDDDHFKDLIMTHSQMMRKWAPHHGLSASLSRIEIHFVVHTRPGGKKTMSYTFHRLEGVPLRVSSNESTVAVNSCTCFDRKFLENLKQKLALEQGDASLLLLASKLSPWRTQMLVRDTTMTIGGAASLFQPKELVCEECGLITLKGIENGS
jgi:hypothetical protein